MSRGRDVIPVFSPVDDVIKPERGRALASNDSRLLYFVGVAVTLLLTAGFESLFTSLVTLDANDAENEALPPVAA